jgi:hypothetical protein
MKEPSLSPLIISLDSSDAPIDAAAAIATRLAEDRATGKRRRWPPALSRRGILLGVAVTALLVALLRVLAVATGRVDGGPSSLDPSWIVRRGPDSGVAVVTLADGGGKISRFRDASLRDKLSYAERHNYTFIAADRSLDPWQPVEWSKLRLVYLALRAHPVVLWLDVDTLVWNKRISVEQFVSKTMGKGLIAQLDLGRVRSSMYWNDGVFAMRDTSAMRSVLADAYRQWDIVLLRGISYFYADQDAVNRATLALSPDEFRDSVYLDGYGEFWGSPAKRGTTGPCRGFCTSRTA